MAGEKNVVEAVMNAVSQKAEQFAEQFQERNEKEGWGRQIGSRLKKNDSGSSERRKKKDKQKKTVVKKSGSGASQENRRRNANRQKDGGNDSIPEKTPDSEKSLREQVYHRNMLEDQIILNLSGKTGTTALWNELVQCAKDGNVGGFKSLARAFLKKSVQVKKYDAELKQLCKEYRNREPQNESERLLALPIAAAAECQQTLENRIRLRTLGQKYGPEELVCWAKAVEKEGDA